MTRNNREIWIDNVKVIACLFVLAGHLFQSMVKANIISAGILYSWFNKTIYMFHVQLFFICSGYLYQKMNTVNSLLTWKNNIKKKLIVLGIPYFTFSILTWVLKFSFSSSVNNQTDDLFHSLFIVPQPPYWYLYCLFLIFLLTPTFSSSKKAGYGLLAALSMKLLSFFKIIKIHALVLLLNNEIWFVIGMCLCLTEFKSVYLNQKWRNISIFSGVLFLVSSVFVTYIKGITLSIVTFLCSIIACFSIIIFIMYVFRYNIQTKAFGFLSKFTLPIFLMHTIFAATTRSMLLKLGIQNQFVHMVLGLLISVFGPIAAALVMEKFKWLTFVLYPNRVIKLKD